MVAQATVWAANRDVARVSSSCAERAPAPAPRETIAESRLIADAIRDRFPGAVGDRNAAAATAAFALSRSEVSPC